MPYLGARRPSLLSETLDRAMVENPVYWKDYYRAPSPKRLSRAYSFSDRCRYYWTVPEVQEISALLMGNLAAAYRCLCSASTCPSSTDALLKAPAPRSPSTWCVKALSWCWRTTLPPQPLESLPPIARRGVPSAPCPWRDGKAPTRSPLRCSPPRTGCCTAPRRIRPAPEALRASPSPRSFHGSSRGSAPRRGWWTAGGL